MNESLKRLSSGVVYVALLIIATSYSVTSFYILFGIFMLIAVYEFCQLAELNKVFPLIFGAFTYTLSTYFKRGFTYGPEHINNILLLAATLFVSVKCLHLLFSKITRLDQLSKYIYVIGYVIFPFILITKIPFGAKGFNPKIIISIFILIWTNDTFAYIVGKSIGKHKLIEKISPKKTIEGFIGGIVFSVIAGILISRFYIQPKVNHQNISLFIWTISAMIISIFSTLGDLIESKFKRIAGVKDSGNIMPGHGGILDRLDSIIFVAPFVYLFYQILYYVHKEGGKIILIATSVTVVIFLLSHKLTSILWLEKTIQIITLVFLLLILQFFRNPNRKITPNEKVILAPVDGKVVVIEEVFEEEYFKDKRLQVSIFMSPINVHVTRYCVSGKIKFSKYHPGKYLVAWHPKASTENERTTVVIESKEFGEILYRQIAGALARRIVNYAEEGTQVVQGDDAGFIKFGSRVDMFFPLGTKIDVKLQQNAVGNQTIITSKA